ncbi:MAG: LuxR family transcriptional regulator [Deltaproteobacteria bacterium]|nr:LuxR family transcriptional regulator [Deltaproteobacteria bacterium]
MMRFDQPGPSGPARGQAPAPQNGIADIETTAWIERVRRLTEETPTLDAYRLEVMRALRDEVGASSAVFLPGPPLTLSDGRTLRMVRPLYLDLDPAGFTRYVSGHTTFRVEFARLAQASLAARPFVDSEHFTRDELLQLRAWRDLLAPDDLGSWLTIPLHHQREPFGEILLFRRNDQPPFEPREARRVVPIVPLLVLGDRLKAHAVLRSLPAIGGQAALRGLTARERQVADLAASGLQNKMIATNLGLSPNTVRNVLAQVYEKLSVTTRTQLAHLLLGGEGES